MANYPSYSNYPNYYGNPNAYNIQEMQNLRERIDKQIAQMQNPQPFVPQPPQIQQTFQLNNPQQNSSDFDAKYTENVEEVKNTLTLRNTLFLTKDMTTMWLKDAGGNVKAYSLSEVIEKDEKDAKIDELTKQIEDMRILISTQLAQNQASVQNSSNPFNSVQPEPIEETPKAKPETKSSKK